MPFDPEALERFEQEILSIDKGLSDAGKTKKRARKKSVSQKKGVSEIPKMSLLEANDRMKQDQERSDDEWVNHVKENEENISEKEKILAHQEEMGEEVIPPSKHEILEMKLSQDKDDKKDLEKEQQEERTAKINLLQKELDRARKEYLEMDYKKRGMWEKVSRFFGNKLHGRKGREDMSMKVGKKTGDMIVDDQDVVYMQALYENKLVDLRNAMLEDAKTNGMKVEDLAKMGKFFEVESKVNLADEHDKVRVENSGRFAGPLRENLVKMNEWYRKQPLKYKLAIGTAFGLGGAAVGFGFVAGSAATTFLYTAAARRIAMGAITGTGTAMSMESIAAKRRNKRAEKGSEKFAREAENLSEEEIKNKLDELIFSADDKLQSYKNWDRVRLALGGAVAGVIGSGTAGDIIKFLSQRSGAGEIISNAWQKATGFFKSEISKVTSNVPSGVAGGGNATVGSNGEFKTTAFGNNETTENARTLAPDNNATVEKGGAKISGKTAPGAKAEVLKNIDLEIKKGSSFEGRLIENLKGGGVDPKEAGGVAHGMTLKFAEEKAKEILEGKGGNWQGLGKEAKKQLIDEQMKKLSLVHPGAKIELSSDGRKIISFHDSPPSEWDKHPGAKGVDQHKSGRAPRVPKIEAVSAVTATEAFDFNQVSQDLSGIKTIEKELMDITVREKNFQGFSYGKSKVELIHLDEQIEQFQNRIKLSSKNSETRTFKEILDNLTQRKMALELKIHDFERFKKLNEMFSGSVNKVFNKIAKLTLFEAGAHEEFSLEKMVASQYIEKHSGGNFGKFYKDCVKIYGKKVVSPLGGENMKDWAGRITKLIVRNRMMSEN